MSKTEWSTDPWELRFTIRPGSEQWADFMYELWEQRGQKNELESDTRCDDSAGPLGGSGPVSRNCDQKKGAEGGRRRKWSGLDAGQIELDQALMRLDLESNRHPEWLREGVRVRYLSYLGKRVKTAVIAGVNWPWLVCFYGELGGVHPGRVLGP